MADFSFQEGSLFHAVSLLLLKVFDRPAECMAIISQWRNSLLFCCDIAVFIQDFFFFLPPVLLPLLASIHKYALSAEPLQICLAECIFLFQRSLFNMNCAPIISSTCSTVRWCINSNFRILQQRDSLKLSFLYEH